MIETGYGLLLATLFSAVLTSALAAYLWREHRARGARAFIALLGAFSLYSELVVLVMISHPQPLTEILSKIRFSLLIALHLFWLFFVLIYTGRENWLKYGRFIIFLVMPLTGLVLIWVNDPFGLMGKVEFIHSTPFTFETSKSYGLWYYIQAAYTYLVLWVSLLFLAQTAMRSFLVYRRQALVLLVGALPPVLVSMVYLGNLSQTWGVDILPLGLAGSILIWGWGVFRLGLFDSEPIAYNSLVESFNEALAVIDETGRVADISPAMGALLGTPIKKVAGMRTEEAFRAYPALLTGMDQQHTEQIMLRFPTDMKKHWYDLHVSTLKEKGGRTLGKLIMLYDISARREAEESLVRINRELKARNSELDAFAHTVAHDLRSPLGSILGHAELLAESTLNSDQALSVETIISVGKKMDRIITELMLLSGLRKMDITVVPLDMELIVAETQSRMINAISRSKAEIILPDSWPLAMGYTSWIEEVWTNLISNAIKYGGKPPRIELGADCLDNHMIRFWVKDNGNGLSPDEQERLFTPFERLDQVRAQGHGLGLSIVRRIIEKLGGQVGVESTGIAGQGCKFYFTLAAVP